MGNDFHQRIFTLEKTLEQKDNQNKKLIQTINIFASKMTQWDNTARQFNAQKQQLKNKLQQVYSIYEKQKAQLFNLKDPKKIEQSQNELFKNFINTLCQFNIYNKIQKPHGARYAAVIGQNSAGKSSIYNWLFGLDLHVGFDDTTQQICKVHVDYEAKIAYFDSPGINESVNITNAEYLKAFYQIDIVFIATAVTFKNCKRVIQVMNKINPPQLYLLRTQCDKATTSQQFQSAVQKDHELLKHWGIDRQILYISSKMADDYKDNSRFKNIMYGK